MASVQRLCTYTGKRKGGGRDRGEREGRGKRERRERRDEKGKNTTRARWNGGREKAGDESDSEGYVSGGRVETREREVGTESGDEGERG